MGRVYRGPGQGGSGGLRREQNPGRNTPACRDPHPLNSESVRRCTTCSSKSVLVLRLSFLWCHWSPSTSACIECVPRVTACAICKTTQCSLIECQREHAANCGDVRERPAWYWDCAALTGQRSLLSQEIHHQDVGHRPDADTHQGAASEEKVRDRRRNYGDQRQTRMRRVCRHGGS